MVCLKVVEEIDDVKLKSHYKPNESKGVSARNSDLPLIQEHLDWTPSTNLRNGMGKAFRWMEQDFNRRSESNLFSLST